jgi:hypothetical protein
MLLNKLAHIALAEIHLIRAYVIGWPAHLGGVFKRQQKTRAACRARE